MHLTQVLDLSPWGSLAPSQADFRLQQERLTSAAHRALTKALTKMDLNTPVHHPMRSPFHTSLPQRSPSHLREQGGPAARLPLDLNKYSAEATAKSPD